jgi:hypothetical protein
MDFLTWLPSVLTGIILSWACLYLYHSISRPFGRVTAAFSAWSSRPFIAAGMTLAVPVESRSYLMADWAGTGGRGSRSPGAIPGWQYTRFVIPAPVHSCRRVLLCGNHQLCALAIRNVS